MSRNALLVATISGFIKPFEMNDISILQEMGYIVHVATNIAEGDDEFFAQRGVIPHHIGFERSPFKPANFKAISIIRNIIEENHIELVHCHTPVGSVISRLAAKRFRKKGCKVIYTVHGLQFYKGAPKKDWLLYYPVEKFLSCFSDAIITINHEDYKLVSEKFHSKKTYYIPGVGVDLNRFGNVQIDRNEKRKELGLADNDIMLLSVGELIPRKNHHVVIDAVSRTKESHLKYYIAGSGPLQESLYRQVNDLSLHNQVVFLGYRTDVNELLCCTDIFVLPSKHEGLSMALMESMAGDLPVICSRIRGNVDLVDDGNGGFLCDTNDADAYTDAIKRLVDDPYLRKSMGEYNKEKIRGFSIEIVDKKMRSIYQEVLSDE
jgi:glycosyltransferase involved in cell wall biosynthesis